MEKSTNILNFSKIGSWGYCVDRDFLTMMTAHHQQAIEMANSALTRAKRPEIKQLAQSIIKDQKSEIQTMAIQMSHMTLPTTKSPEIQTLARSIVKTQAAKIGQMQNWYQTW